MHVQQRPCVTNLDDLIYRHASPSYLEAVLQANEQGVCHIDHLHIDVEGHDYDVLSLIDWKQLHPIRIQYKHTHLGEKKKQMARDLLSRRGYVVSVCRG
jgi:Methyltransferase FkbM domain